MKNVIAWFTLSAVITTLTGAARAQSQLDKARILFDAGAQAYAVGRYNDAVESFREAYALSGKPQAIFSLAQAERRLFLVSQDPRNLYSAIEHFRKYLEGVPEGGRRGDATEALEQLEVLAARIATPEVALGAPAPVIGKILISTTTPDALIRIDDAAPVTSPLVAAVSLGKHKVQVSAPGHITEVREVEALEKTLMPLEIILRMKPSYVSIATHEGALLTVDGQLVGEMSTRKAIEMRPGPHTVAISLAGYVPRQEAVVLEPGQSQILSMPLTRTRQRIVAYSLLGIAGTSLLGTAISGGVYFRSELKARAIMDKTTTGNLTQKELDDYNAALNDRDFSSNVAIGTFVGASVIGAVGVVAYVFDSQRATGDSSGPNNSTGISLRVSATKMGVGIEGRF